MAASRRVTQHTCPPSQTSAATGAPGSSSRGSRSCQRSIQTATTRVTWTPSTCSSWRFPV